MKKGFDKLFIILFIVGFTTILFCALNKITKTVDITATNKSYLVSGTNNIADSLLMRTISYYGTSGTYEVVMNFGPNIKPYSDSTITLTNVPYEYYNSNIIVLPNEDANQIDTFVTFNTFRDQTVLVARDQLITVNPSWLSGWTKTSDTITTSDNHIYDIYSKTFAADASVSIGANVDDVANLNGANNQIVFTKETAKIAGHIFFSEDFDDFDQIAITNAWKAKTGSDLSITKEVVGTRTGLRYYDTTTSNMAYTDLRFNEITDNFEFEYKANVSSTKTNSWLRIFFSDGPASSITAKSTLLSEVYLYRVGDIIQVQAKDEGNTTLVLADNISLDEWHTYRFLFDFSDRSITVSVDGVVSTSSQNGISNMFRNAANKFPDRAYVGSSNSFDSDYAIDDFIIKPCLDIGATSITVNGTDVTLNSDTTSYVVNDMNDVSTSTFELITTDSYESFTVDKTTYNDKAVVTIVNKNLDEFTFDIIFDNSTALAGLNIRGDINGVTGTFFNGKDSIHFTDNSTTNLTYIEKSFENISSGIRFSYDFYIPTNANVNNNLLKTFATNTQMFNNYDTFTNVGVRSYLTPIETNNMGVEAVSNSLTTNDTNVISRDTWHNIEYEINVVDRTYKIFLDDVEVASLADYDFFLDQSVINNIVIGTDYEGTADFYVSNIVCEEMSGAPIESINIDGYNLPDFDKNVSNYSYYTDAAVTSNTIITYTPNLFFVSETSIVKNVDDQTITINVVDNLDQTITYVITYINPLDREITKANLQELYDSVADTVIGNYTISTFDALDIARSEAYDILEDNLSLSSDYSLAYYNLEKAINNLLVYQPYNEVHPIDLREVNATTSVPFNSTCKNSSTNEIYSQLNHYEVSLVSTISYSSNLSNAFTFDKVVQNGSKIYNNSNATFSSVPYQIMNSESIIINNQIYKDASFKLTTNQATRVLVLKDWNAGPFTKSLAVGTAPNAVSYTFSDTGEIATASDGTIYKVYISTEIPANTVVEIPFDTLINNNISLKNNVVAFIKSHNANNDYFFYEKMDDFGSTEQFIKSWDSFSACNNSISSATEVSTNQVVSVTGNSNFTEDDYLLMKSPSEKSMPVVFKEFADLYEKVNFKFGIMTDNASGISAANQKYLRTWLTFFEDDYTDGRAMSTGANDKLYSLADIYTGGTNILYNQSGGSTNSVITGLTLNNNIYINYDYTFNLKTHKITFNSIKKSVINNGVVTQETMCTAANCLPKTINFTSNTSNYTNYAYFSGRGSNTSLHRLYYVIVEPVKSGMYSDLLVDSNTIGNGLYQDLTKAYLYKYDPTIDNLLSVSSVADSLTDTEENISYYPNNTYTLSNGNAKEYAHINSSSALGAASRDYYVYFEADENDEKIRLVNLLDDALSRKKIFYTEETFNVLLSEIEEAKTALSNHKINYTDTDTASDELESAINGLILKTDKELKYEGKVISDYNYDSDFENSMVNITNDSSLTVNYSIHKRSSTNEYLYDGLTHEKYLVSDSPLVEGTIITFEDLSNETSSYYSYTVTAADYLANKTRFHLDDFIKSGTTSVYFESGYNYNNLTRTMDAEYNFIIDFIATGNNRMTAGTHSFSFEVEIEGVVESTSDTVTYNIYSENVQYNLTASFADEYYYTTDDIIMNVSLNIIPVVVDGITVTNTTLNNLYSGLRVSAYSPDKLSLLPIAKGTYIMDGDKYNRNTDGRIRVSRGIGVQNFNYNYTYSNPMSNFDVRDMIIQVDYYNSYYSFNDSLIKASVDLPISIRQNPHCSISASISGSTGVVNIAEEDQIEYTVNYGCHNITNDVKLYAKMYKKNINLFSDFGYTPVDLASYMNSFVGEESLTEEYSYLIKSDNFVSNSNIDSSFTASNSFKNSLPPGTYKMEFKVCSADVCNVDNLYFYAK